MFYNAKDIMNKLTGDYIPSNPFRMFEILPLNKAKVVIIGESPYPGKCPVSDIYYACGPAFMIPDQCFTCPQSLKILFKELKSDIMNTDKDVNISLNTIRHIVKGWVSQGVFLTNVSLTIGTQDDYLKDHKMFWMNFTISFVKEVCLLNIPIVLLGKEAWELSKYIVNKDLLLKFYHPASRNNEFLGCHMFTEINNLLDTKIDWLRENDYFKDYIFRTSTMTYDDDSDEEQHGGLDFASLASLGKKPTFGSKAAPPTFGKKPAFGNKAAPPSFKSFGTKTAPPSIPKPKFGTAKVAPPVLGFPKPKETVKEPEAPSQEVFSKLIQNNEKLYTGYKQERAEFMNAINHHQEQSNSQQEQFFNALTAQQEQFNSIINSQQEQFFNALTAQQEQFGVYLQGIASVFQESLEAIKTVPEQITKEATGDLTMGQLAELLDIKLKLANPAKVIIDFTEESCRVEEGDNGTVMYYNSIASIAQSD